MSTRSFVGTVNADKTFRARYVHSDGYPTGVGETLAALIALHGVEETLRVVTEEHYGWSNLNAYAPDITNVRADSEAAYDTPAFQASLFRGKYAIYGDGRFENIPGYGIAYTTKDNQSSPDDWITGTLGEPLSRGMWTEWGYLIDTEAETLTVVEIGVGDEVEPVVTVPLAEAVEDYDWSVVECGADYSRCSHYAWFHFEDIPEESRRLATRQWLGEEPLTPDYATGVVFEGKTYSLTGGGMDASLFRSHEVPQRVVNGLRGGWLASARAEDGEEVYVRTKTAKGNVPSGLTFDYPPTKVSLLV